MKLLLTVRMVPSPKGEAIIDSAQGAKLLKSYLSVCVCVSVNNAARCTSHVLSTI